MFHFSLSSSNKPRYLSVLTLYMMFVQLIFVLWILYFTNLNIVIIGHIRVLGGKRFEFVKGEHVPCLLFPYFILYLSNASAMFWLEKESLCHQYNPLTCHNINILRKLLNSMYPCKMHKKYNLLCELIHNLSMNCKVYKILCSFINKNNRIRSLYFIYWQRISYGKRVEIQQHDLSCSNATLPSKFSHFKCET